MNSVDVINGVDKPEKSSGRIMPPIGGKTILASEGFDHATKVKWDLGDNKLYNQTDRLGSDFADIPAYLGDTKDVLILSDSLKRTFSLDKVGSSGYRTLRIWICARLNPPIYNPDRYASWKGADNPYTNASWYGEDKYDYDDLHVIIKYNGKPYGHLAKSVNSQKVGLFLASRLCRCVAAHCLRWKL